MSLGRKCECVAKSSIAHGLTLLKSGWPIVRWLLAELGPGQGLDLFDAEQGIVGGVEDRFERPKVLGVDAADIAFPRPFQADELAACSAVPPWAKSWPVMSFQSGAPGKQKCRCSQSPVQKRLYQSWCSGLSKWRAPGVTSPWQSGRT
jgi:hypothetical protein